MNGSLAKKVRKLMKRAWKDFYSGIYAQPFRVRFLIAWAILWKKR